MIRLLACARLALLSLLLSALVVAPALADPKAALMASYEAMAKFGKFRTTSTTVSGAQTIRSSVDVVWPDRFHMRTEQMEMTMVPGHTYMKQGGKWQELPMDMGKMVDGFRAEAMKATFAGTTNVQALGPSTINGKATQGYEYDVSATIMGIASRSHVRMWIEVGTNLPVRQEIDGEAMGQKSRTVQDYEFDAALRVDAPL